MENKETDLIMGRVIPSNGCACTGDCEQAGQLTSPANDDVNHPSHYTQGNIEVLDFIMDQDLPYLPGNVVKYICRYRFKGDPVKDLKKARFYLDKLIDDQ